MQMQDKNECLSLLADGDEQCPHVAANCYVLPLLLCVTDGNDRRYCGEWWILQQELTCKGWIVELEIYLKVGVKVKRSMCGA